MTVVVDIVGAIVATPALITVSALGVEIVITPAIMKPGWHVNMRWRGVSIPASFAATRIADPATPARVFV